MNQNNFNGRLYFSMPSSNLATTSAFNQTVQQMLNHFTYFPIKIKKNHYFHLGRSYSTILYAVVKSKCGGTCYPKRHKCIPLFVELEAQSFCSVLRRGGNPGNSSSLLLSITSQHCMSSVFFPQCIYRNHQVKWAMRICWSRFCRV